MKASLITTGNDQKLIKWSPLSSHHFFALKTKRRSHFLPFHRPHFISCVYACRLDFTNTLCIRPHVNHGTKHCQVSRIVHAQRGFVCGVLERDKKALFKSLKTYFMFFGIDIANENQLMIMMLWIWIYGKEQIKRNWSLEQKQNSYWCQWVKHQAQLL